MITAEFPQKRRQPCKPNHRRARRLCRWTLLKTASLEAEPTKQRCLIPICSRSDSAAFIKFDAHAVIRVGFSRCPDGRYVAFQMADVALPRNLFADTLRLIAELRPPLLSTG